MRPQLLTLPPTCWYSAASDSAASCRANRQPMHLGQGWGRVGGEARQTSTKDTNGPVARHEQSISYYIKVHGQPAGVSWDWCPQQSSLPLSALQAA